MLSSLQIAALILAAGGLLTACQRPQEWNGSLEEFLKGHGGILAQVVSEAERHRLQIIYTQIDRDERGIPEFRTYGFRLDQNEYFYPASTVKLPAALAALEKLEALAVPGLDSSTAMLTGAGSPAQTAVSADPTAPGGLPSIAHYVRKILLVSDNDAYNRLYEFTGHDQLNEGLRQKGYRGTRIIHRLEVGLDEAQNRETNPVSFVIGDRTIYQQAAASGTQNFRAPLPVLLGEGEIVSGDLRPGPKDFAGKNAFPLREQHDLLKALLFPDTAPQEQQFRLSDEDRQLVLAAMSTVPADSGIAAFADRAAYPDGYVKFLMFGGDARHIPANIRVFNKSGQAYGFLTDMAYFVDSERGVEFLLGATLYTNANGIFNDDVYEYEAIGFPFMRALGEAIYALETGRRGTSTR
jgi:hypothetical protein